jgi:Flp pilus assembly protein TadD
MASIRGDSVGSGAGRDGQEAGETRAPHRTSLSARDRMFAALLLAAVLIAYQPAWNGGFVWDDVAHVTRPDLRSWHGLWRIWFDVGATQQYYPLLHSAFWVQQWLWGERPLGYHVVNIALHACAALLAGLTLRRLSVPGAYLAALIFALHPVHVESVAWISELKNTLSAVFYLAAALAYLRFREQGPARSRFYALALLLFALALASKTVTATLPVALLAIDWWRQGRLSWRRDIRPLVPFAVLGAAAGLFTAWMERHVIGAEGAEFALGFGARAVVAGRATWFYLASLAWPVHLTFIYPRWRVDTHNWWQYLYPAAALVGLVALWAWRRRGRGPLAAAVFFVGTLFPVLGFFNVYPFLFSFVADHFQYLASLGIIALVAAGIARLLQRVAGWRRSAGHALCLALLTVLTVLTWRQSRLYADVETLYRATITGNPACWMAYNNLAGVLIERGAIDEALPLVQRALALRPDYPEAFDNLGLAMAGRGQIDQAVAQYRRALELRPDYAEAHSNLGLALASLGQIDQAIGHFRRALEIDAGYSGVHYNLAMVLSARGDVDGAVAQLRNAIALRPDYAEAHDALGIILSNRGHTDEARAHFAKSVELKPDYADAHNNLGIALARTGRVEEAISHFRKALELNPGSSEVRDNLLTALASRRPISATHPPTR